jgi:hypothetical protein
MSPLRARRSCPADQCQRAALDVEEARRRNAGVALEQLDRVASAVERHADAARNDEAAVQIDLSRAVEEQRATRLDHVGDRLLGAEAAGGGSMQVRTIAFMSHSLRGTFHDFASAKLSVCQARKDSSLRA